MVAIRLLLAVLLVSQWVHTGRAQEAGRLEGTVVTARGGQPLEGVTVVVVGTLFAAVTDAEGRFEVVSIPPGTYSIQVNALDYEPVERVVSIRPGEETVVQLQLQPPRVSLEQFDSASPWRRLRPSRVLEARQLRVPRVADSGQLLRDVPGAGAGRLGGIGTIPSVRGVFGTRLGVVVDGARLTPDPLGMLPPFSRIDPVVLDRVELVGGPYALAAGGALPGTVLVETEGPPSREMGNQSVFGAGYASNLGAFYASGTTLGKGTTLGYRVSGIYREGGDYETGAGERVPSAFRTGSLWGHALYQPSVSAHWTLSAAHARWDHAALPGLLGNLRNAERSGLALRYEAARSTGTIRYVDAAVYGEYLTATLSDLSRTGTGAVRLDEQVTDWGARVNLQLPPTVPVNLEAGVDLHQTRATVSPAAVSSATAALPEAHLTQVGGFLRVRRSFLHGDVGGVIRADAAGAGGEPEGDGPGPAAGISGSAMASIALSPVWTLQAAVGTAWRAPDLVERYAQGLPAPFSHAVPAVFGTPDLEPERSTQLDVWLEARYERITLRAGGFARHVADYISLAPVVEEGPAFEERAAALSVQPFRYRNGEAAFIGGEGLLIYALLGDFVTVRLAAQYMWGRDEQLREPPFGLLPPSFGMGFHVAAPARLFFLEGDVRIVGDRRDVAADLGEVPSDAFVTSSLRTGIVLPGSGALSVGIENVTDTNYSEPLNARNLTAERPLQEPGRYVYIQLRYGI